MDIDFEPAIPDGIVIEFGSLALGWKKATITAMAGNTATIDIPHFLLGPQDTLVDLRFTSDDDLLVVEDAFTYLASDFTEHLETWSPSSFAPDEGPVLGAAGEFISDGSMLLLFDNMTPQTQLLGLFIGIDPPLQPPLPFKGGLLGVNPIYTLVLPIGGLFELLPSALQLGPLNAEGASFWFQIVTAETSGFTDYGHSATLQATIRIP